MADPPSTPAEPDRDPTAADDLGGATGPETAQKPMVTPIETPARPVPQMRTAPMPPGHDPIPCDVVDIVLTQLDEDQAADPILIDLAGKSTIADFMIVASGRSARHVMAIADHVDERLRAAGARPLSIEGKAQGDWVLIDAGDLIVHIFRPEVRAFYNIERMWGVDGPVGLTTGTPQ